jgi:hypothetical protein
MTSRLRTLLGCAALLLASAFGTAGVASAQSINITGCASLSAPVVSGNNVTITATAPVAEVYRAYLLGSIAHRRRHNADLRCELYPGHQSDYWSHRSGSGKDSREPQR